MVNETHTILPAAAQHLASTDPVALAIREHRLAFATSCATSDRWFALLAAVDPDLDADDTEALRAAFAVVHGAAAETEIERLMTAQEASEQAGEHEESAWRRLEAIAQTTPAQSAAWTRYVKAHAARVEGAEVVFLRKAIDRLATLLGERLAA